jgi:hypothetical protein
MADPRANLTQAQIDQIMQQGLMPQGWYVEGLRAGNPTDGRYLNAQFSQDAYGSGEEAGMVMNPNAVKATHFTGYDQSWADGGDHQGEKGQVYKADGTYSHDFAWKDDEATKNLMMFLAAAGGMAMLPGGAFGGMPGAPAGGPDFSMGFTDGGTAGGALDVGYASGGLTTGNGAGVLGAGGASGGSGAAGAVGAVGGGGSGGGGLLSQIGGALGGGGSNNLLGIGATLLGGALGGKGQEQSATQTRDIPEWLKPYVMKGLGYGSSLLDRQMSPESQAQWDTLRNASLGLLSRGVAQNPWSK